MGEIEDVHVWTDPESTPETNFAVYDKSRSPNRFLLTRGERLPEDTVLSFTGANGTASRNIDSWPNSAMLPLVSARAADILMEFAGPDIQMLNAKIDIQGGRHSGHGVVNILRSVHAIDHSKSKYLCVPGTTRPMRFERLRFLPGCLEGYHLARNAECRPQILISKSLRNALLSSDLLGFEFQPPSRWWP